MMTITGKSVLIWKIQACEEGNVDAIVAKAKAGNFDRVSIKAQDGAVSYNTSSIVALVNKLKEAGIAVDLWAYLYGSSVGYATLEAQKSVQLINLLEPDVFCWDIESPYKRPGSNFWAMTYLNNLIPVVSGVKFAMMSYRYPNLHPQIPWNVFLADADYHMPQVYWQGSHNPTDQLEASYDQLTGLKDLPFYPVGSAYCEHDWCATADDISEFAETAVEMDMDSYAFYSWDYAANFLPDVWQAMVDAPSPGGVVVPPPPPPVDQVPWFVVITNRDLNVRSGPGLSFPVLFYNQSGTALGVYGIVIKSDYTWVKISQEREEWSALTKNSVVFAS